MNTTNHNITTLVQNENGRIHIELTSPTNHTNKLSGDVRTHWWLTGKILTWFGRAVEIQYQDGDRKDRKTYINVGSLVKNFYCTDSLKTDSALFNDFYKSLREKLNFKRDANKSLTLDQCLSEIDEQIQKLPLYHG